MSTDITVAVAETLRRQLEADITKLVHAYERATGMRITEIEAGHFERVFENGKGWSRVRVTPLTVDVRL